MNVFESRRKSLQKLMTRQGIPLVAVNAGTDLAYFTGLSFHLSERPAILFVPSLGTPCFFFPEFEREKVKRVDLEMRLFPYLEDTSQWLPVITQLFTSLEFEEAQLAVAPESFRFLEMQLIQQAAPRLVFTSAAELFTALRIIKDDHEIAAIRKSVRVAEAAFKEFFPLIRPGQTEVEIANQLFIRLLEQGSAADLPFHPIVASGPNGANPHAVPGSRNIQAGDIIVIDWGACVEGYIADMTRTISVGEPSHQALEISNLVKSANQAGRKAVRPGIPAGEVDLAARSVITAGGYGEHFIHRTGHGIGLKAHEEPYISAEEERRLEAGMTFTVEPGIYLSGWGGVRIEDNVLVTHSGVETLTSLPRDLWITVP